MKIYCNFVRYVTKCLASFTLLVLFAGCTNVELQNAKVPAFDSSRYSNRVGISPITVKAINIQSTAEPMKKRECPDNNCGSKGVRVPIKTPIEFGVQVQTDLRTYFSKVARLDNASERVINVSLYKAQAYKSRRIPTAGWIPVVGLFVPDEYKIGLPIGVEISVYEGGQLVSNYKFDRDIEVVDPVSGDSKDVYPKVIEEYRHVLFSEIEQNVISQVGKISALNPAQPKSLTDELQKLAEMKKSGLLTETEFNQAKAALLEKKGAQ